jgi:glycosyltransferase involved in cell wall biosynthesis
MKLSLIVLLAASLVELTLWIPSPAKIRQILSALAAIGLVSGSALLLIERPALWSIMLVVLSLYRIVNDMRVIQNRHNEDYFVHIIRRSSGWLIVYQLIVGLLVVLSDHLKIHASQWWYALSAIELIIAVIVVGSTKRHMRTTKAPMIDANYADRDLPTLSVLIPARNETDELTLCLQSLIESLYPKLEILVLDDCSQNTRTPEIIRAFAHDGVRFIAGKVPPEQWLAKNYAYEQLSEEANGEYLLFCGVDTNFTSESLRALIDTILVKKKSMLSILPENTLPHSSSIGTLLVQPCRYAWELSLPRRLFKRPPVLSSCWLIRHTEFQAAGTFKAVSRSVSPERYFANYCATHLDGYSFLCSNSELGVSSKKSLADQRATAIRTRYPQLHRRLEQTALLSIAELALLVLPFVLLITSLVTKHWLESMVSVITCLLLLQFYSRIVTLTYRKFLFISLVLEPFAALYDIGLLNYSLWKYEFSDVVWKDRNICIPVMRVIPRFPRLP